MSVKQTNSMKNKTIVILIMLLQTTGFAQINNKIKENYLGFHFDINQSRIYSEYNLDVLNSETNEEINVTGYHSGYSFGVSYKNFIEKYAGISLELNYITKGGYNNFYYDTDIETADSILILFKQELNYLEFPVYMNLRFGKKNGKFNAYAGPHVGYLLYQKLITLEDTNNRIYQTVVKNKFDFGLNIGFGYGYSFGNNSFEFLIKYSHSLSNIFEQQTINKAFLSQNQVISASLYYYYKI